MQPTIEIETFTDWVKLLGESVETGIEWQKQNFEPWCLLWMEFAYGPQKALERYQIITNSPERETLLHAEYEIFLDLISVANRLLFDEKNPRENGSGKYKKTPTASFGAGGDLPGNERCPAKRGNRAGSAPMADI